jgi:hypothetical protein
MIGEFMCMHRDDGTNWSGFLEEVHQLKQHGVNKIRHTGVKASNYVAESLELISDSAPSIST